MAIAGNTTTKAAVATRAITNSIGMKLALIPPEKFKMGTPRTELIRGIGEDEHEVQITRLIYMGVYEVTQEQYARVMGSNPSQFTRERGGGPNHPVESVSWDDAVEFCKKLSETGKPGRTSLSLADRSRMGICVPGGDKDSVLVRRFAFVHPSQL
jgi:formylglycine-generating enzyme required for sulfatase activity